MTTAADPVGRTIVADGGVVRVGLKREADLADDYAWRTDPETARFDGLDPLEIGFGDYVERMRPEILYPGPAKRAFIDMTTGWVRERVLPAADAPLKASPPVR